MIVGQAPPSTLGYRVGAPNRFTPEAQQYAVGPRLRKGLPLRTRIWHGKAEHSGMYQDVRTGDDHAGGFNAERSASSLLGVARGP